MDGPFDIYIFQKVHDEMDSYSDKNIIWLLNYANIISRHLYNSITKRLQTIITFKMNFPKSM